MNMAGLSLDQAPPFWSVARFFVTASIFGALFGVALVFMPSETVFERFSPSTIAAVHLYTIGFFAMTIFGALMQMLPVLAGVSAPKASLVALVSYTALCIGALAFFAGFYFDLQLAKRVAVVALSIASLAYFLPMLYAILRAGYVNFTIWGMRLSLFFAVIAFCLGLHLLSSYAFGSVKASQVVFADIHIALASFGFVAILIVAVAHQVLPMFYVAPHFPDFCKKFIVLFAVSLALYAGLKIAGIDIADTALKVVAALVISAFATVALKKISERRRKISDASLKLWQFGLACAIVSSALFAIDIFWTIPHKEYLFAALFGFGFATSIMKAMLNKIVPFLVWFHLTSKGAFDAPNINELLPQRRALIEAYLHIAIFAILIAGYFVAPLVKLAGALMIVDFLLLASNLSAAAGAYKRLSA
jgi:hypothetical protein